MNNISRRDALRVGGLSVFGAAFLAACGKQSGVVQSANILSEGEVTPTTALPEGVVTDVVLLRTAASLEYNESLRLFVATLPMSPFIAWAYEL